jgi:anaerobic glycerol-3-phosphate dehydrogenase
MALLEIRRRPTGVFVSDMANFKDCNNGLVVERRALRAPITKTKTVLAVADRAEWSSTDIFQHRA